ncbi:MAG TPA: polysaccharide pyruvyl transferase family protein [Micropepsaceae bacterium]|nr:polysaccharide pyruvyl transferase family protein [Micropepsaceae bacterium]
MTSGNLVNLYIEQLRAKFAPLIPRDRPMALVDFPDSTNCGDHAIWLGERKLLAELGANVAYACSVQSYDRDVMAAKIGNGTILMQGGGNFGDRYPLHHEFRLRVLQDFPKNRVVIFPQQVTFLDNDYLQRTADFLAGHPDVTLFARGVVAQHMFTRYFGQTVQVELAPDMAFMLGEQTRPREAVYDIVWIARTDQERANDQTEVAARLASQGAEKYVLPRFPDGVEINFVVKQRPPTVFLTDWYSLFFENEEARLAYQRLDFDARAEATIARALYILSLGRVVITDRLHGHIFCLLLGIPHVFLNNDSGKNWNFYETWTRDSPLCRLARNPAEAWSLARSAVPKLKEGTGGGWSWQSANAEATPADTGAGPP